ncbi:type II toxin-antitoxin system HipA family toxin [Sphaerotilus sp.]|uniref:type II toxin-antitoxin system HipA family toxin n=1 Tax=Sphaerotilus sp. TaxID=2093942 RepID=UPI00286E0EDE|nr:type II toxin-antitoxin system HipA family toxin [Sphaerotilus sp.]
MISKKVLVHYAGWGERWLLGTLAHHGHELLFEYSAEALQQGLELSPRHLPLRSGASSGFPAHQQHLPGLIADALPDGWGLLVMDRLFRQGGVNPATVSPLDRLMFLGERTLGALTFEPADPQSIAPRAMRLLDLAHEASAVVHDRDSVALRELALLGGSPQGARPKVLVHHDPRTAEVGTAPFPGSRPWLVKFQARGEHKEVCALEDTYAQLARDGGLDMPETRCFDLDTRLGAFGIARFDVEDGLRVPVHTLAGALQVDFRLPSAVDYTTLLRATRLFTRDEREVRKAYERAVFNVVFHNRDDHAKNVSFRLGRDRGWRLAPCYDLTFCEGPGGEHQMDVCGEGRDITRAHLLTLASQGGLDRPWAAQVVDHFAELAGQFAATAATRPIRAATVRRVRSAIEANRRRLV